jgi:hypothetical protein
MLAWLLLICTPFVSGSFVITLPCTMTVLKRMPLAGSGKWSGCHPYSDACTSRWLVFRQAELLQAETRYRPLGIE